MKRIHLSGSGSSAVIVVAGEEICIDIASGLAGLLPLTA
jgi:hypothetical protein